MAVDGADGWPAAGAEACRTLLRADKVMIMRPGESGLALSGHGIEPDVLEAYAGRYAALDHGMLVRRKELGVEVWSRGLLWDPATLRRSEYYNGFVVPGRLYDAVGMTVDLASGPAGLSFYHARPNGARFGDRALELLRVLLPAFRAGVEVWARVARAWDRALGLIDVLEDGLLLCDRDGRIVHVNRALQRLLERDPERDQLQAELRRVAGCFARLGDPATDPVAEGAWAHLSVEVCTAGGRYRLRGALLDPGIAAPAACVLVTAHGGTLPLPPLERLCGEWGLTPRQAAVAALLAEGRSNAEVAERLGISPHTARHHTESVLMKLGVRSRAEVAARLLRDP
ncbi:MAG TPA: helix-turn-helix transcriptional regulator [Longimicrobiales bacterium]